MDAHRFDAFTRLLGNVPSRRELLPMVASLLAAPLFTAAPAEAKKKKKKKVTLCLDGQTIQASKKKKKKLLKSGATPGACPPPPPICTPNCTGSTCGGDDGCGGICRCATNAICHEGICQTCTVTCSGDVRACGAELQAALSKGGTVFACPGRFVRNFTLDASVKLIGAGDGTDPEQDTILDADGLGRVIDVVPNVAGEMHKVRITGGNLPVDTGNDGGGIRQRGALSLADCTIAGNTAGDDGGGIYQEDSSTGPLTLTRCTLSGNTAAFRGGALRLASSHPSTITDCLMSNNTATTSGGAIRLSNAQVTINGTTFTGNKTLAGNGGAIQVGGAASTLAFNATSSITDNTATGGVGGGIRNDGGPIDLNGALVRDNEPDNCSPQNTIAGCFEQA